jgi:hypothetical protein
MLRPVFWSNVMRLEKIALVAIMLIPAASYAALGGAPATGQVASAALAPSASTIPSSPSTLLRANPASTAASAPYTARETRDADGVTIREYILPTNVVFAVTWQGPVRPDMSALLGSYFANFVSAGEAGALGTGPLIEHNSAVHIESAGRAGNVFGKAYVPRLVPTGVRVEDLQ